MAHAAPPIIEHDPTPIERIIGPFQRFARMESSGGVVLLAATIIAVIWANSPWWESYHHLWESPVTFRIGDLDLEMTLHHFINDGLMVVFFFLVGLEIKRELMVGELATPRAAMLPIAGALGGMVAPALIYVALNVGGPGLRGWGIPMATDIAFAIGVLALFARGVPLGLKVFLVALAIVDDLGAVLVIALFYTSELNLIALGLSAALFGVVVLLNRAGARHPGAYAAVGFLLWLAFLASGVHATIAGVLLAMAVPARTRIDTQQFLVHGRELLDRFEAAGVEGENVLTNSGQQLAIQAIENTCEEAQAPLIRIEHDLQPWVAFGIIPLFALANAGVHLEGDFFAGLSNPITLGVILGLVVGKPLGITLFSWAAVRMGVATLPTGVDWFAIHAVSWLGGIGFTMSLFVATLAFGEGSELLDLAKIGVLTASLVAAVLGSILVAYSRRRSRRVP